ncbi:MAG: HlyD family efflux transporter periplasmic adaptor subunit [Spirochaetaceae bacterium]
MKSITMICFFIIMTLSFSLMAQSYQGGGRNSGRSGGLFSVANPAKAGRVVTIGGRLSPALKISHTVSVSGYIETILVKVGDRVYVGQPLIRITRNVAGETFLPVIIESRIKGVVSEVNVFEKQEVNTGTPAVTILDNSSFLLITSLSDRDTQAIRNLGEISVSGITTEGESYNGRILYISQEPDYNTGLFTLNIRFPNSQGLFLGMVLFVDIEAQKGEGITVESNGLVRDEDKTFLWKINKDNKLTLGEIEVEKESESKITVSSGILAGERYINKISGNEKEGMELKDLIKANLNDNATKGKNDA